MGVSHLQGINPKFGDTCNCLEYYSLISAILVEWKRMLKLIVQEHQLKRNCSITLHVN